MNFHLDASQITFATFLRTHGSYIPRAEENRDIPIPVSSVLASLSVFLTCFCKYNFGNQHTPPAVFHPAGKASEQQNVSIVTLAASPCIATASI